MTSSSPRVRSGVPGVDEMIGGGLPEKSVTMMSGAPGIGKSNFALQFIYQGALDYGEPGVYLTVEESPEDVKRHAASFGWDLDKLEKDGMLAIVTHTIYGGIKKESVDTGTRETLNDAIKRIKAKRVVLDSVTLFKYLFPNEVSRRVNLLNFIDQVKSFGCTSLIVAEQHQSGLNASFLDEHFLADGLFVLFWNRHWDKYERCFKVVKMRGTDIVPDIRPFKIGGTGIVVYPTQVPLSLAED